MLASHLTRSAHVAGLVGRRRVVALVRPRCPALLRPLASHKGQRQLETKPLDPAPRFSAVNELVDLLERREVRLDPERRRWLVEVTSDWAVRDRLATLTAWPVQPPKSLRHGILRDLQVTVRWFPGRLVVPMYMVRDAFHYDSAHTIKAAGRLGILLRAPGLHIFRLATDRPTPCVGSAARRRITRALTVALALRGYTVAGARLSATNDGIDNDNSTDAPTHTQPTCRGSLILRLGNSPLLAGCDDADAAAIGNNIVEHMLATIG